MNTIKALRRAEECLQLIPELKSQVGSAGLHTEMKLTALRNDQKQKTEKLNLDYQNQVSALKAELNKYANENTELRRKLEYAESKAAIMSLATKELLDTHKVLLQYFQSTLNGVLKGV